MTNNKNKIITSVILFLSAVFLITGHYLNVESINNKDYNLKTSIVNEELKPAFNDNNIPVVFASDNNYVKYLSVAIVSLTDNMSKDYNYDIVILDDNIKDKSKKLLLEQVKDFKNISLRFIDMNECFSKNKIIESKLVPSGSRAICNRLFIPNIFQRYSRVFYLDVDILINSDLTDLFNINLDGKMIAGVNDFATETWLPEETRPYDEFHDYINNRLGINDPKEYINSGVIIFDIEKCLKDDFLSLCLEALKNIGNQLDYPDQDLINIACSGRIKYLDYRYNFFASYVDDREYLKQYIPEYVLDDIKIIHFAGHHPWRKFFFSSSIARWLEASFRSPFFKNKKKYLPITIYKLKLTLLRYKICHKIYRSERRVSSYERKIKGITGRIEFFKGMK